MVLLTVVTAWLSFIVSFTQAAPQVGSNSLPIVDLGYAVHQGTLNQQYKYYNFSNIRYAAPPTGKLRFSPPSSPATDRKLNNGQTPAICPQGTPAWAIIAQSEIVGVNTSSLKALQSKIDAASTTPQNLVQFLNAIIPVEPAQTEDCLFLDVIAPQQLFDSRSRSRPARVMVWLHGGGFVRGSKGNANKWGDLLAEASEPIVFVTFNYRLGLFGFSAGKTFEAGGTPNLGLLDQRFAFDWIKKNIHQFGGDPNRISVVGSSAGGSSALHHITAFGGTTKAPFNRAIIQSPAIFPVTSKAVMEETFQSVLTIASTTQAKKVSSFQALKNLSSKDLMFVNEAQIAGGPYGDFTYSPSLSGNLVTDLPSVLIDKGRFDRSVEVLTGKTYNEGILFTSPFIETAQDFDKTLSEVVPNASLPTLKYIKNVLYPAIFDGSKGYKDQATRMSVIKGDWSVNCNNRAIGLARKGDIYSYLFTMDPGWHGLDSTYTFFSKAGDKGIDSKLIDPNLARAQQNYMMSFSEQGNPNRRSDHLPQFSQVGSQKQVMELGPKNLGAIPDPVDDVRCKFWIEGSWA